MVTLKERVATLEAENEAAKPLHERFQDNFDDLNDRTARIETKVDRILENGVRKPVAWSERVKSTAVPAVSGGGLIAVLLVLLERLG